jgi:hypothetical protein
MREIKNLNFATNGIKWSTISPIDTNVFSRINPFTFLELLDANYAATAPPKDCP